MRRPFLALAMVAALAAPAMADTLYQAAPPPAAPGHPLRLGPDHKATQVGDLVQVVFNFKGCCLGVVSLAKVRRLGAINLAAAWSRYCG